MERRTVQVPNISCGHCVMAIQRELSRLPGVANVSAELEAKTVTVEWGPPATWDRIASHLEAIGYPPA